MRFKTLLLNSLKKLKRGSLDLSLPNGVHHHFGGLSKTLQANIEVKNEDFFRKSVIFGPIGFAEAYMAGDWDTTNLTKVIAWFILNADEALETESSSHGGLINFLNLYNRILHMRRPNSLHTSKKNISEHYDLSNDFFKLWLDPTMTYSSAYYDPPDLDLEAAQIKKYDVLCKRLFLNDKDSVLEIGTGWGGFSMHAAKTYGCKIRTVTISQQQFDEASKRIQEAGLADRITVELTDYRLIRGQFDKIASIEMLEAVGDRYLETYFAKCHEVLKPTGMLGLQMIICPDRQFKILRDGVDFIQKHIFPGSLLLSVARVNQAINKTGGLNLFDHEDMGVFYAKTLKTWCDRFEEKLPEVRALGFDEVFIRKWRYYLCYCEAAFGMRHISVVQNVYTRPNNTSIPSPAYDLLAS
ncbi:MAG: cyclopropane-fatty-acyl-phospholipid synthase family protein [Chthoniobacterales bacterium]